MRTAVFALVLLLGATLPQLWAGEEPPPPPPNQDGPPSKGARRGGLSVSPERMLEQAFRRIDRDRDGKISLREWGRGRPRQVFEAADKNKDGVLDKNEAQEAARKLIAWTKERVTRLFQQFDADKDGKLSTEEFARYAVSRELMPFLRSPQRMTRGQPGRPRERSRRQSPEDGSGDQRGPDARGRDRLMRLDGNGDGKVSRTEFPGNDAMFKRLDRNGDGFIDQNDRLARPPGPPPQGK